MPWKAPICAPWSYTYTCRLHHQGFKNEYGQGTVRKGANPRITKRAFNTLVAVIFTGFLPFFLSFSSSSHPFTARCSGRWVFPWQSWKTKNFNFRTLERVPSVMLTSLSVMLEYSWELMGQNKKFSPLWEKNVYCCWLLHFFPKYMGDFKKRPQKKEEKSQRLSIFSSF